MPIGFMNLIMIFSMFYLEIMIIRIILTLHVLGLEIMYIGLKLCYILDRHHAYRI